ncbi:MAG: glycosyltransferase family A protein [Candidatus Peribacteraceae bacterium]|jgi:glycosyltransferase involved in cell wall biosynthesis
MDISVVIPAYNEEKYIGGCIESILAHKPANLKEIVVVDNASTDGTARVASSYPMVRVVRETQKGLTKARQRGFMESHGDVLAYVDADSRVAEDWFAVMNREFSRHPDMACLSGPCDYYDLSKGKRFLARAYWKFLAMPAYYVTRAMVLGSNFVARRTALERIGGFDTTISFYGEDTDIARRLKTQGKVRFIPAFTQWTSARRFAGDGMMKTGVVYVANFLSAFLLHRPVTTQYRDIR